jgi:two-component system nitrogen regulation response regulator NtrX
VDVRVIVATHRNLEELVESGTFRRDLYHRVVVFPMQLPPLRQRREDLPLLVQHFARQVSLQNGWKPVPFSAAAMEALQGYGWPGNIRELRNVVERLLLLADSEVDSEAVRMALPASPPALQGQPGGMDAAAITGETPLAQRVIAFERATVLAELEKYHRHITQTARALGLERSNWASTSRISKRNWMPDKLSGRCRRCYTFRLRNGFSGKRNCGVYEC